MTRPKLIVDDDWYAPTWPPTCSVGGFRSVRTYVDARLLEL